jgi:molybdopterin-guanine dinucleotide biosynthesis protein A
MPTRAIVLVGGASRRFGADKAALRVGGEPLIDRVAGAARDAGLPVCVVGRDPAALGALGAWPWIPDSAPTSGPLAALLDAADDAPGLALLALPVDLPRITAAHVARLAAPLPDGATWRFVTDGEGRSSPLPGLLAPPAITRLRAAAATGERSLWRALRDEPGDPLDPAALRAAGLDPLGFADADTAEAWRRLGG